MTVTDWNSTASGPDSAGRRSQRVILSVSITVTGNRRPDKARFSEDTRTLVVNGHGALIGLTAKVDRGDTVVMRNCVTQEERACRVMYLGRMVEGKIQVGLEFVEPAPDFWHVAFPTDSKVATAPRQTRVPQTLKKVSK
jgi:hypothetical protein